MIIAYLQTLELERMKVCITYSRSNSCHLADYRYTCSLCFSIGGKGSVSCNASGSGCLPEVVSKTTNGTPKSLVAKGTLLLYFDSVARYIVLHCFYFLESYFHSVFMLHSKCNVVKNIYSSGIVP